MMTINSACPFKYNADFSPLTPTYPSKDLFSWPLYLNKQQLHPSERIGQKHWVHLASSRDKSSEKPVDMYIFMHLLQRLGCTQSFSVLFLQPLLKLCMLPVNASLYTSQLTLDFCHQKTFCSPNPDNYIQLQDTDTC